MATPLTIGNFEFDKLRAKSQETKKVEMLPTIQFPSNMRIGNCY